MNLLQKMEDDRLFSRGEREVVHFLLEHPTENLTIKELVEQSGTSNATVIRMCRKLGYDGYRQFKLEFIKEVESRKYLKETVDYSRPFQAQESMQEIICKMGALYKESADLLLGMLDGKAITEISRMILKAQRVYIYAVSDSMITARGFANKLLKLNIYPTLVYEYQEEYTFSYNMTGRDCAVFLSYSLSYERFKKAFKMLKSNRVPVLTITANENHAITKMSTYKLIIPRMESEFKIAPFYSQFAFGFLCDVIYAGIYALDYQYNQERKQELDEAVR